MSLIMRLTEAMNTYNIALFLIKEKGYSLKIEIDHESDEVLYWTAHKGPNEISAFNPLSLLALVTVFEQYGEKWTTVKTGDIYGSLLES